MKLDTGQKFGSSSFGSGSSSRSSSFDRTCSHDFIICHQLKAGITGITVQPGMDLVILTPEIRIQILVHLDFWYAFA